MKLDLVWKQIGLQTQEKQFSQYAYSSIVGRSNLLLHKISRHNFFGIMAYCIFADQTVNILFNTNKGNKTN